MNHYIFPRTRQIINLIEQSPIQIKLGVEIGVYEAHVSAALLENFPGLEMALVDSWRPFEGGDWISTQPISYYAEMLRNTITRLGDLLERSFIIQWPSPQASTLFDPESVDFAFIDGNHQREPFKRDVEAWWPKIRPGGFISGHDYVEADDPLGPGGRGVKQGVCEFALDKRLHYDVGADSVWWIRKPLK